MKKELIKLANYLNSKGLTKEADIVDRIISKSAQHGGDDFIDVSKTPNMYPYGKPKSKQKGRVFFPGDNNNPLPAEGFSNSDKDNVDRVIFPKEDKKEDKLEPMKKDEVLFSEKHKSDSPSQDNGEDDERPWYISDDYDDSEYDAAWEMMSKELDEDEVNYFVEVTEEIKGSGDSTDRVNKAEKFLSAVSYLDRKGLTNDIFVSSEEYPKSNSTRYRRTEPLRNPFKLADSVSGEHVLAELTDAFFTIIKTYHVENGTRYFHKTRSGEDFYAIVNPHIKRKLYRLFSRIGVKYEMAMKIMKELKIDTDGDTEDSYNNA